MLVITHWRPMPVARPLAFDQQIDAVLGLIRLATTKAKKVPGLQKVELFYNVAGMEVVSIDRMDNYATIDALQKEPLNMEIGLRLVKLGYGIHSVEYLHEVRELEQHRDAYREL
jgi:hypothetical protein